jgi:TRAP-type C4-dicarboxylate transport system permease small subunit
MSRFMDLYMVTLKALMALLLSAMVVLVFGNVVMRYLFDSGISVSDELARWFFVWMVFLGAIVGVREHKHLGLDTMVRMLSPAGRKICFVLSHGLMIFASVLLVKGSWLQTLINLKVAAPATGLSTGLFYGTGIVFGVSTILIFTWELVLFATGRLSEDDLIGVRETEEH